MREVEKQLVEIEVKTDIVPKLLTDIRKILGFLGWVLRLINPKQEQRLVDKVYAKIVIMFDLLLLAREIEDKK